MAPCRQLIMWSVPSIAVLLGIYWFKKKREYAKSDPGGREKLKTLKEELAEALNAQLEDMKKSPIGKADRSLIKSAPIDIIANGCGSQHSSPMQLTDEEVDIEIDKIIRRKSLEKEKRSVVNGSQESDKCVISGSLTIAPNCTLVASFKAESPADKFFSVKEEVVQEPPIESKHYEDSNILQPQDTMTCDVHDSTADRLNENDHQNCSSIKEESCENAPQENEAQFSNPQTRCISERDSANHSPVDPLLASPSVCHFSDSHSEGSSDSGKGCSEAASPPPANMNMVSTEAGLRIHQFLIPQTLVGLLIGKYGSFVTRIKAKTGATVYVRKHPELMKQKICAIEGTQSEIEAALEMIKEKFPEKRFPNFTTQEISAELYQRLVPLLPEFLQLQLVESVNNDTIMTCLVSAGHFFLQQPLHPTFPSLHALHRLMATTYQNSDVPSLPHPIKEGSICAAPTENNWYRAQVISTSEENDTSVVKLVDFGGYLTVDNDQLRQIRSDFMTLPFQATEALLAFVKPANNEAEWSGEALRIMAGLTAGQLLHAQVAGYDEAARPLVHLYLTINPQQVIFLNQELVDRGLAEWDVPADS